MGTVGRPKALIGFYVSVLCLLLLCVVATPLVVTHGISITSRFIIEEETFESALIVLLFGVSYLILRGFRRTLDAYAKAAARAGKDKSRLVSQLAEAFTYIGTVNVEIQEIQSIYCGVACYPQTKRELKQLLNRLAAKAMAIAGTPWVIIRMVSRYSGRTVKEVAIERRRGLLPSSTVGNRVILEGGHVDGLTTICSRRENIDLLTVCVLPETTMGKDETVLITAIITLSVFTLHTILRLLAIWRNAALTGFRGWMAELPGLIGIVLLIATAYLGGELVYHFGVNVAAVAQ